MDFLNLYKILHKKVAEFRENSYFCIVHILRNRRYCFLRGCKITVGHNLWEASLMLCFDPFEPRKFKSQNQDKRRDECYGCVVYTPRVCRGIIVPSCTLLGVLYTYRRGYSDSVCSIERAFLGPKWGTGRWRYPAFSYIVTDNDNDHLTQGYQSETKWVTDARKIAICSRPLQQE